MEGRALLSIPRAPSPGLECQVEVSPPRRKAAAALARRPGNPGHRPHLCQGHLCGPGTERPRCARWGRRVSRGLPCSGSGLGPGGPPRGDDANGPPGRARSLAGDRRERPGLEDDRPRALARGQPGAPTALRAAKSGLRPSENGHSTSLRSKTRLGPFSVPGKLGDAAGIGVSPCALSSG